MYVAITRARKRLYLSYAGSRMLHGQPRYGIVSRFVEEIPRGAVQVDRAAGEAGVGIARRSPAWDKPALGRRRAAAARRGPPAAAARRRADPNRYADRAARELRDCSAPTSIPSPSAQNVRHAKFGEGVVINFEGRGLDARVQVRFRARGHQVAGPAVRQAHAGVASRPRRRRFLEDVGVARVGARHHHRDHHQEPQPPGQRARHEHDGEGDAVGEHRAHVGQGREDAPAHGVRGRELVEGEERRREPQRALHQRGEDEAHERGSTPCPAAAARSR